MRPLYIIEDNLFHIQIVTNLLSKYKEFQIHPFSEYNEINELLTYKTISSNAIFLIDIELKAKINGIDVAEKIRNKNQECQIIFLTSDSSKAIEIINRKIYPIGYIEKNNEMDISKNLDKILYKIKQIDKKDHGKLLIDYAGVSHKWYIDDILFIENISGMRNKIIFRTIERDTIINYPMKELKKELTNFPQFLQLKYYCINLNNIEKIESSTYVISFKGQVELRVGRKITEKVRQAFKEMKNG